MSTHFIGIKGAGVSAVAGLLRAQGQVVSGSDSALTGHRAENLPRETDLVVYSLAIPEDNPERVEAKRRGLKTFSYPEFLGELSKNKFTIAVAGTHGKTTTTAMLAEIMIAADLKPTVIVGAVLSKYRSNFVAGESNYFLVEACEYRRSFLHLSPKILVITNIDNDHLDYYHNLAEIKAAFAELAAKVPVDGKVIAEREYAAVKLPIALEVPGAHNQRNAQAAIAAARALGVSEELARAALAEFGGTARRLEYRGRTARGAAVYDDYAHHPTEIQATLAAARTLAQGKIWVVFQPHLYSRTKLLFAELASSLGAADRVFITDIYAAREPADNSVSGAKLAAAITANGIEAAAVASFSAAAEICRRATAEDIIITMGAGDIYRLVDLLIWERGKSGIQKLE